jgi:hypothetical protein
MVSFSITTTTHASSGAVLYFEVHNSEATPGRVLYSDDWGLYGTDTRYPPLTPPWFGTIKGMRGVEGQPGYAVLGASYAGLPDVEYSITMTKLPRPDYYNAGGVSLATAPLISLDAPNYGSVHQFEPGNFTRYTSTGLSRSFSVARFKDSRTPGHFSAPTCMTLQGTTFAT